MDILDAIRQRHSVRAYTTEPIEDSKVSMISTSLDEYNRQSGLALRLVVAEPRAFSGRLARYGKFDAVRNYIAVVGPAKEPNLDEKLGYWGEHAVLLAQMLGLNTCWVGLTFSKVPEALGLKPDEKLRALIAIGYGASAGVEHKIKSAQKVAKSLLPEGKWPEWFKAGVDAALLAPTAVNQQKFHFTLQPDGRTVSAKAGLGFFSHVDLGIVKYHFEQGAGKENFDWQA